MSHADKTAVYASVDELRNFSHGTGELLIKKNKSLLQIFHCVILCQWQVKKCHVNQVAAPISIRAQILGLTTIKSFVQLGRLFYLSVG